MLRHTLNSQFSDPQDIGSDVGLKLSLARLQEGQQLLHHGTDVVLID